MSGWVSIGSVSTGVFHVIPEDDLIAHEEDPDCVCIPECIPELRSDGSAAYLYSHSSLDGRELRE